jgi:Ca-activated chloride channel family protein
VINLSERAWHFDHSMPRMERMPGRHRKTLARTGAILLASATAVVVVVGGSWFGYQQLSGHKCSGQIKLSVAAATEIAPAVEQVAQRWMTGGAEVGGTCVSVAVSGVNSVSMAAAIAGQHHVALAGVGSAPGSVNVPDVWVPDSSTWLLRIRSEASGFTPTDGRSIAQSPIVLAAPEPIAKGLGWPARQIGWKDLLGKLGSGSTLKPGIVDPARDASGLIGLLALGGAAGSDASGTRAKVLALRTLAASSSSIREDLLQKFPQSAAELNGGLAAAPLSEEDVITYNKQKPPVGLAAVYLQPAPMPLDYPFTVMPEVDLQRSSAAAELHKALEQADFRTALAAAGLRGPDGVGGSGFGLPTGAPATTPPAPAGDDAAVTQLASGISQLLGSWAAITQPGRVLSVFDVSGSMLTKVPTAGGLTRAQVTQRAATQGLALFDDRWAVGNWIFSTDLVGKQAWRELVPITPLTSGRTQLQAAIGQIIPKKNGDTGLYDTALAAYREVQSTWQAGRVNSVLLFTDGKNDNKDGITRDQLVTSLRKLRDPKRPVRMVIIGIGNEVDRNELQAIVGATSSGGVFIAEDPAKISEIFLEAIATRTGA